MARWDLRIQTFSKGETMKIPPGIRRALVEGDVPGDVVLQGAAKNLEVQVDGSVHSGARIQLAGPNASLKVAGGISNALILLSECSLVATDRGWLDGEAHIHTRGACGKLHISGKGHGFLFVEPDEQKDIEVQIGGNKQIAPSAPPMRSAHWLPHILPGHVPYLRPHDKRRCAAIYGGFTIPAFNESYRDYLRDLPGRLRKDCSYCNDLRSVLRNL